MVFSVLKSPKILNARRSNSMPSFHAFTALHTSSFPSPFERLPPRLVNDRCSCLVRLEPRSRSLCLERLWSSCSLDAHRVSFIFSFISLFQFLLFHPVSSPTTDFVFSFLYFLKRNAILGSFIHSFVQLLHVGKS